MSQGVKYNENQININTRQLEIQVCLVHMEHRPSSFGTPRRPESPGSEPVHNGASP